MTEDEMWKCHSFLAKTDRPYAEAVANKVRLDRKIKATLAFLKQQSNEKSVGAKETEAYASHEYQTAMEEEFEAVKALELLKAQRSSATLKIDIWRSLEASRRRS